MLILMILKILRMMVIMMIIVKNDVDYLGCDDNYDDDGRVGDTVIEIRKNTF